MPVDCDARGVFVSFNGVKNSDVEQVASHERLRSRNDGIAGSRQCYQKSCKASG